jgi:hypothetical protein
MDSFSRLSHLKKARESFPLGLPSGVDAMVMRVDGLRSTSDGTNGSIACWRAARTAEPNRTRGEWVCLYTLGVFTLVQRGESPRTMTLLESLHKQVSVHTNVLARHRMSHVIADRFADVIQVTEVAHNVAGNETQKSETIIIIIDPKQGLRHEVPRADSRMCKCVRPLPWQKARVEWPI